MQNIARWIYKQLHLPELLLPQYVVRSGRFPLPHRVEAQQLLHHGAWQMDNTEHNPPGPNRNPADAAKLTGAVNGWHANYTYRLGKAVGIGKGQTVILLELVDGIHW